ncbi:MAG: M28 family peptidase [Terracidiphilus sp.]
MSTNATSFRRAAWLARLLAGAVILATFSTVLLSAQTLVPADPDRYIKDIQALTTPQMEGRGNGSHGLKRAEKILVERYRSLGLEPKGTNGFLQPFTVITGAELKSSNHLTVEGKSGKTTLALKQDWVPFSFSASATAKAGLVFAGYGITAEDRKYDDYAGLDAKGKIVVVLRGEPAAFEKNNTEPSAHAQFVTKAINARNHGAAALLLVNGKLGKGEEDLLTRFGSASGPEDVGLPFAQVKNAAVESWFAASGTTLAAAQEKIESASAPASFAFPAELHATLETAVEKKKAVVNNVLAYLPGKSDEYVILGAHYDHLGRGEYGSLAPSQIGTFHPGADDNGSGTAGLLELARILAPLKGQLPRGILFESFAGEELGLLGSAAWVKEPTLPIDKAIAMLNMDMIGRIQKNTIYVGGVGTGAGLKQTVEAADADIKLKAEYSESGYSSSDHTSFLPKKIPVLFFFSGLHSDYHKPSDTWEKIDAPQAARVVNLVAATVIKLDEAPQRPAFQVVAEDQRARSGSGGPGYGAYFGSIPDFGQVETGVRFSDVRPGSPAAKAGLKGGDTLIEFRGQQIKNLYDFTDALRRSKVGDMVEVTVLRDGKPLKVSVTLEQRK